MLRTHHHIIIVETTKHLECAKDAILGKINEFVDDAERKSVKMNEQSLFTIVTFNNSSSEELCSDVSYKDLSINRLIHFDKNDSYYRHACGLKTLKTYIENIEKKTSENARISFYVISNGIDNSCVDVEKLDKKIEWLQSRGWLFSFYSIEADNLIKCHCDDLGMFLRGYALQLFSFRMHKSHKSGVQYTQTTPTNKVVTEANISKPHVETPIDKNDKFCWIEQLKNIQSRIIWQGTEVTHYLTGDDHFELENVVSEGSGRCFSYIRDQIRGNIIQEKPLPWNTLREILIRLPFACCKHILLPYDESYQFLNDYNLCAEQLISNNNKQYIKAEPFINKKDQQSIIISFLVNSREEDYDEDGFGGGTYDDYALGIIDSDGKWAIPLIVISSIKKVCVVNDGVSPDNYIAIPNRENLLW